MDRDDDGSNFNQATWSPERRTWIFTTGPVLCFTAPSSDVIMAWLDEWRISTDCYTFVSDVATRTCAASWLADEPSEPLIPV